MQQLNYNSRNAGKSIMQLPIISLNKMLFLSGLAFCTGVLITIGLM